MEDPRFAVIKIVNSKIKEINSLLLLMKIAPRESRKNLLESNKIISAEKNN